MILIILLSFLPVAAAWFWLRSVTCIKALTFLAAFSAGLISLALAAAAQALLPKVNLDMTRGSIVLLVLRTALTEEGGRLAALSLLFAVLPVYRETAAGSVIAAGNMLADDSPLASAGMIAGLAFAAVETASLAAANPAAGPIRLISAVFLHAACGIRCALAAYGLFRKPLYIMNFILAAALHAVYNFMSFQGGVFTSLAILLAVSSFLSGLRHIKNRNPPAAYD
jgi:hypothetical protein